MLISTSKIERSKIHAQDGTIGKVETFLFDEDQWVLRYIVAKHGFLFVGGKVLLSPVSVTGTIGENDGAIRVGLTKEQVKNAPAADLASPISRQKEEQFHRYYQIPVYWGGAGLWGTAMTPMEAGTVTFDPVPTEETVAADTDEYHLRSTEEVAGYRVEAQGERVGTVSGFLIEDTTWAVRYLSVAMEDEYGGGKLFISPHWVDEISWIERKLKLDLPAKRLREMPTVGVQDALEREDEEKLHEFFGQPRYWK